MRNYFDTKGRDEGISREEELRQQKSFEIKAQYYLDKIGQLIIFSFQGLQGNELRLEVEDDFSEHLEISEKSITQRYFEGDCTVSIGIDRITQHPQHLSITLKNEEEFEIVRDAFFRPRMRNTVAGTCGIQAINIICSTNDKISEIGIPTEAPIPGPIPDFHSRAMMLIPLLNRGKSTAH